ncbi:MAG TPA: AAA family ATPase [Candidatus Moranbacteria bacterium]|nr:AAA family ATPase [Candidatus Moranbacteria bacterium]
MQIIGHNKIIKYLDKAIAKDMISQAYLFSGPAHLGKFTLALEFAKKITGGLDRKINPDIIIISPETEEKNGNVKKKDIKIEKIRELEHELSLTAYFGKHKVVIIDEAQHLTISSQNALLKTLEEPPQKAVIILIAENPNKIISTIKSRCVIKKFSLVKKSEIDAIISSKNNAEDIGFLSLSRPGLAINLSKDRGELEKRQKAREDLKKMFEMNLSEKFSFCEELSKNVPEMIEKLNFWLALLRKNILENCKIFNLDQKKSLALILNIEKSLKILNETNSNSKLVMENLALEI